MTRPLSLLRILARFDPRLWEVVHPHLPVLRAWTPTGVGVADEVALNPQPLPPKELLRLETVHAARAVAEATIAARLAGRDSHEVLQEVGDDWCPTRPRTIPWPRYWPHPWPPSDPYPIADEIDRLAQAVQAQAASVFRSYAAGVADEQLAESFDQLAERLEESALTERSV